MIKIPFIKDFEEKFTFTKHAFKESDYDSVSIWEYDWIGAIDKKIQEAEKRKKILMITLKSYIKNLKIFSRRMNK